MTTSRLDGVIGDKGSQEEDIRMTVAGVNGSVQYTFPLPVTKLVGDADEYVYLGNGSGCNRIMTTILLNRQTK